MFWLLLILSYLLGSVSFAILLCKITGKADPRSIGSGNPGATNIMRVAGLKLAILTLLGDLLKGIIPVLLAHQLGLSLQQQAWIGLAAVIGHLFPVYFHFKGGKGIATAAGMLMALSPWVTLVAIVVWALVFYFTRTSSLSSLIALVSMIPLLVLQQSPIWLSIAMLFLLIIWRHRRNLHDLFTGNERHF